MVRLLRAAATGLGSLVSLYLVGLAVVALLRTLVTQDGAAAIFLGIEEVLPACAVAGAAVALALGLLFAPSRGDWRGLVGFAPALTLVLAVFLTTGLDPLDLPASAFGIAMLFVGSLCGMALAALIWKRQGQAAF